MNQDTPPYNVPWEEGEKQWFIDACDHQLSWSSARKLIPTWFELFHNKTYKGILKECGDDTSESRFCQVAGKKTPRLMRTFNIRAGRFLKAKKKGYI